MKFSKYITARNVTREQFEALKSMCEEVFKGKAYVVYVDNSYEDFCEGGYFWIDTDDMLYGVDNNSQGLEECDYETMVNFLQDAKQHIE